MGSHLRIECRSDNRSQPTEFHGTRPYQITTVMSAYPLNPRSTAIDEPIRSGAYDLSRALLVSR
jgi:hypothetical protein